MAANTRRIKGLALVVLSLLLAAGSVPLWRHYYPVQAASGWQYEIYRAGIPSVSALIKDEQDNLYATEELLDGKGKVMILPPSGPMKSYIGGLSKPDGLTFYQGGLVYSQEVERRPVIWQRGNQKRALFIGNSIEEVTTDGYYLYGIEDLHGDGRLLRYDPDTETVSVLREGLDQAEAVSPCPDGTLFYLEKKKGEIRQWQPNGQDPIVLAGLNAPGFMACTYDGLWITEDATHMARLLLLDKQGRDHVILSHLRAAQTLLPLSDGTFLLSEQGRNRILKLQRSLKGAYHATNG
ncbi:hypothetical protein IQ22_02479 [Pseudomonas duriflava]|uniref:Strictosidine synthase n=1 Tax=Pseudomonas duriflava TaxID=459528 RepID=A0A562QAU4_9PSED|nr:hypothetical protein [Pseudomonas duriflava]TWI53868.1 hypothetical protein IQ22_02479 [Pseudomonas duriflava]